MTSDNQFLTADDIKAYTIKTPRYHCPKCMRDTSQNYLEMFAENELLGRFCIYCLADLLSAHLPQLEERDG